MQRLRPKQLAKIANQSFTLPDICVRIREMLDDDNSGMEEIGELITLDPALASKLLKLANSPIFRFESQVDTMQKAISIIGGEALYNLVMAETARSAFEHFSSDVIDLRRFWVQSLYCGLIAKHLAKIAGIRGSERFFVLGLLHNLGELIVAVQSPELAIKANQYDKQTTPWNLQNSVLGFTYAQCSAELMTMWHLPTQLSHPVKYVHNQHHAKGSKEITVLYIAARAAIALAHEDLYSLNQLVQPMMLEDIKLEQDDLDDAVKFAVMEGHNLLNIMNPKL